jgi:glycerol-3-phosphate dehydrogenase subunit B
MRNEFDTLVIGGGFSGLLAALVAAEKGKKVAILTTGAGSLTIGGGTVDLLGYINKKPVKNPYEAMGELAPNHPYRLLGMDKVREAVNYFKKVTAEEGYPYSNYEDANSWMPTALGNIKPTFLRSPAMNPDIAKDVKHLVVLSVEGLKDFFPQLMIEGLQKQPVFRDKTYSTVMLKSPYDTAKDLTAFDLSSYVSRQNGEEWLLNEIYRTVPWGNTILMPPLFGVNPTAAIRQRIEGEIGVFCTEMSVMPPSVTGMRLRTLLKRRLKKYAVEIIEHATVSRADVQNRKCTAIYTTAPDKERRYVASDFIVATGGFLGGGCIAEPGKAYETIFGIDLHAPKLQELWSSSILFGNDAHPFASMGVKVNDSLQAVDAGENILMDNVRFVGRTIGGYDFVNEKSGNGVALVSAYCAAGGSK